MIESFPIAQYELLLRAKEPLFLPIYKGSTFRGGFGTILRRIVCIQTKGVGCKECLLRQKCLYAYIFEAPPPEDSQVRGKYAEAPHPFIIEPPLSGQTRFAPGETLTLGLILIGKAQDYLPYFIFAFDELGRQGIGKGRGKYQLEEVKGIYGPLGQRRSETIYSFKDKTLRNIAPPDLISDIINEPASYPEENSPSSLTLNFITPTRIKAAGHLTLDLNFPVLLKHLLERLTLLSYFHGRGDLDKELVLNQVKDLTPLLGQSQPIKVKAKRLYWYDWERYSSRQDSRMKLGGFIGRITYRGELSSFLSYLRAGQLLHVGKGTSLGLGKYEIESDLMPERCL